MENSIILPRVTEIIRGAGLMDLSSVPPPVLEAAQKFGTAMHKTCELWDKNDLDMTTLSEPLIPYLEGWRRFRKDYNISIAPDMIECRMQSKKWHFQGTPDRYANISGKWTIIDIKSSTAMYPATELQTAGYQILVEETTGLKVYQRWGVQLTEKGTYKVEPYTNPQDRTVFLGILALYNWKKKHRIK